MGRRGRIVVSSVRWVSWRQMMGGLLCLMKFRNRLNFGAPEEAEFSPFEFQERAAKEAVRGRGVSGRIINESLSLL